MSEPETTTRDLALTAKLPPREEAITKALVHPQALTTKAYGDLRRALPFDEDTVHDAFVILLEALRCDHVDCECVLKKASEDVRCAVGVALTRELEETGILARTFVAWCRNHRRLAKRLNQREQLARTSPESDDHGASAQVVDAPMGPGELWNLRAQVTVPMEDESDRPAYHRAIIKLFLMSKCSESQTDAFITINSRDGREPGSAVPDSVRRAASVARRKIDDQRAVHGLLDRGDFEAALEEHYFDHEYAMSA